jgi:hypothetical protein
VKTAIVAALVMIFGVVLAVSALAWLFSPRSMCGSHGNYIAISPDGTRRAVLYEFDCGATTDFGTHLAVQSAKGKFDPFDADED